MTDDDADDSVDEPLTEREITTMVARLADQILLLTEDPSEHEKIVNCLGDVLEGWDRGFPFAAHPYNYGQKDLSQQQEVMGG